MAQISVSGMEEQRRAVDSKEQGDHRIHEVRRKG